MQTYIERDIRDLAAIHNESKFHKFVSCAAVRTGQELNLSDIAKDVGIDSKTADSREATIFENSMLQYK